MLISVDFLPELYWECKPKFLESLNVLLYHEIRYEVGEYIHTTSEKIGRAVAHQLVPQLYKPPTPTVLNSLLA